MEDGILLLMSRYLTSVISELRVEYVSWAQVQEANAAEVWGEFEWAVDCIALRFPRLAIDVVDWLSLDVIPDYEEANEELPF